jgi:hypothetical protein
VVHAGWNDRDTSVYVSVAVALKIQSLGLGRVEKEAFGGGERIRIQWERIRADRPRLLSLPAETRTWDEETGAVTITRATLADVAE